MRINGEWNGMFVDIDFCSPSSPPVYIAHKNADDFQLNANIFQEINFCFLFLWEHSRVMPEKAESITIHDNWKWRNWIEVDAERRREKALNLNSLAIFTWNILAFVYRNMNVASSLYMLILLYFTVIRRYARVRMNAGHVFFVLYLREEDFFQTKKKKQFTCKEWAFAFLQQLK